VKFYKKIFDNQALQFIDIIDTETSLGEDYSLFQTERIKTTPDFVNIEDISSLLNLGDIENVNTSSLNNYDFLVYDNTQDEWVNKTPSEALLSLGTTATALELNYNDISLLGTAESSKVLTFDANGNSIVPDSLKLQFGTSSDMQLYHDGTNSFLTNAVGTLKIATETSGVPVQIGHSTSEVTIGQNLTVIGNLSVNGTTTTINSTITTLDDPVITLGGDTAPSSDDNKDRGIEFRWHNGSAAKLGFFGYDDSTSKFTFIPDSTKNAEVFSGSAGDVAFGAGEFSGDLVVDTSTLKVDSSNNRVGIGTSSPAKTLHVVDTTGDAEIARFEGGDGNISINGGAKITFSRNAVNYLTCTDIAGSLRFETGGAGNNRLTIDSTGNSTFSGDVILDNAKSLRLSELDSNGSNHISIKAPDSVTSDVTLVLPNGTGTAGQALTVSSISNSIVNLDWSTVSGGGGSLASSDITGQTAKTTVNDNDLLVIADSQASNALKKITRATLVQGLTANNTYSAKTANFTAAVNYHYSIDTTSGAVNVSLPQLSTTTAGESIVIKFKNGTKFLTLVPYSGNTIEGLNNLVLTDSAAPGQSVTLVSNGSAAWEII